MKIGVIGRGISYSLSPKIHFGLSGEEYSIWDIQEEELKDFFLKRDFDGINVTIPYKERCMEYLDDISPLAKDIGAVNTIVKSENGKLVGYNTDYMGFILTAKELGIKIANKKVLVLGNGGASKAVQMALLDNRAKEVYVAYRGGDINFANVYDKCSDCEIIVNATPLGSNGELAVDLDKFKRVIAVIDLVYSVINTPLLIKAKEKKISAINGLFMLVQQAEMSNSLFHNRLTNFKWAKEIYKKIKIEEENISLIGMPGAGKTEIGKEISKILKKDFYDTDIEYYNQYKITPSSEIEKNGEEFFRKRESEILKKLVQKKNAVISTGGGIVLDGINRALLMQNTRVIYIKRKLKKLDSTNRPLLKNKSVKEMFNERGELYNKTAEFSINNKGIEGTAILGVKKL